MEYNELINKLNELKEERFISIDFIIWKWFDFRLIWNIIELQLDSGFNYNKKWKRWLYDKIVRDVNWMIIATPKLLNLSHEQSLEILFHHYPFGYDNKSNSILMRSSDNRIVWINFNNLKSNTFIETNTPYLPDFIVINNKYKLAGKYSTKDLNTLLPYLQKLCAE